MNRHVHGRPLPPPPDLRPRTRAILLSRCWAGVEPAESLDPRDREQLVYELWLDGWTDAEIATHTKLSTYTAARIRDRLVGSPGAPRRDTPHVLQNVIDLREGAHEQPDPQDYRRFCHPLSTTCPLNNPQPEMTGGASRCCLEGRQPSDTENTALEAA